MCPNRLKENGFRELESYINSLDTKEEALITVLHKAQEIFGYLPKEVQEFIADKLNEPLARVYGVVSFYSFFTMIPKGDIAISVWEQPASSEEQKRFWMSFKAGLE